MKKLNKKGLGHHMLLAVVAVVAVVGAAGYFVWQRQGDGIDAKAAGLAYIAPTDTTASKYIKMYACKNRAKTGSGFVVSFGGQKTNSGTYAYRIKKNSTTWQTVYFNSLTYAYPPNKVALSALGTDRITFSYYYNVAGGLPAEDVVYRTVTVSNILNC